MATSGSLIILRSGRISVLVQGALMPGITFLICAGEIVSAIRRGSGSSRSTIHAPQTAFPGKSGSAVGIICTLQFAPVLWVTLPGISQCWKCRGIQHKKSISYSYFILFPHSSSDRYRISLLFSHFQPRPRECGTESIPDGHPAFNGITLTGAVLLRSIRIKHPVPCASCWAVSSNRENWYRNSQWCNICLPAHEHPGKHCMK